MLTFSPLRSNTLDGGVYVFSVTVGSNNSSYVVPATVNKTFTLAVDDYPPLNISKSVTGTECDEEVGFALSASVSIINTTKSNRNITYTWSQEGSYISQHGHSGELNSSLQVCSLKQCTMTSYDLAVCLNIVDGELLNHCSNTTFDVISSGEYLSSFA